MNIALKANMEMCVLRLIEKEKDERGMSLKWDVESSQHKLSEKNLYRYLFEHNLLKKTNSTVYYFGRKEKDGKSYLYICFMKNTVANRTSFNNISNTILVPLAKVVA